MANIGQALLFLDDNDYRKQRARQIWPACTVVDNVPDCIKALELREWVTVSLDHDLNQEEYVNSNRTDCGMEVVRYIVSHRPSITECIVHSHNEPAAIRMAVALTSAGYNVYRKRFGEGDLWTPKR